MSLRRALHARGHRYRVDAPLPGMPGRRTDLLAQRPRRHPHRRSRRRR
nr:hypothetical protein [Dermacoccus sp. PAMC28757]